MLRVEREQRQLPPGVVDDDTLLHSFLPRLKGEFGKFMYHALLSRSSDGLWSDASGVSTWEGLVRGAMKWARTGGQRLE